ncbi:MAG TPA: hypothetical protein VIX85_09570 [Acidimicrobiales bacterium]
MHDQPDPDAAGSEPPFPAAPAGSGDEHRPAFYAARPGGWRDWWTVLHPPYTAWHLGYVVIGACLAPNVDVTRMVATLLAFLFAVGFAAHALDELHGRPLGTRIPTPALVALTLVGLAGAIALGIVGLSRVGWPLIPFLVLGPLLVVAYNLELLGGVVHTDAGFALAWGSFPVLVAYVAQTGRLALAPVLAAIAAFALSLAQRRLSTPARLIRRRAAGVEGRVTLRGGALIPIDQRVLLAPLEGALVAMTWGVVLLATSLAIFRLG